MLCTRENCTGCFACFSICPKKCIIMSEDDLGFIYPIIDEKKCIKCGLCDNVCPSIYHVNLNKPKTVYASWNINHNIRKDSTSGGVASAFYNYIIKEGGICYGVVFDSEYRAVFKRAKTFDELTDFKGSKYVHAYINDAFKEAKSDLNSGRLVLFIGTPCQIAGLKKYLGKDYANLYSIDIVCHGVPSQKMLRENIESYTNLKGINKISFRNEDGYRFKVYKNDKLVINKFYLEDLYLRGFMNELIQRDNCYKCYYAKSDRCSDITIGDYWGLGSKSSYPFKQNISDGVSLLIPSTNKGSDLIHECGFQLFLEQRTIEEAISGNSQLNTPITEHKNREKFLIDFRVYGFKIAAEKALSGEISKYQIKKILKRCKLLYSIYRWIFNRKGVK